MLVAFNRLVRERPSDSASVIMACTVDEEFTHTGSSRLAESIHGVDLAIVAEPTLLHIVDRHKGAVRWKIRTRGVACHSSTRDLVRMPSTRWPGSSRLWRNTPASWLVPLPTPCSAPELLRRPDRGRDQLQRGAGLVRGRRRPSGHPGRDCFGMPSARLGSSQGAAGRLACV